LSLAEFATKNATENSVFFSATGFFRSASKMATAADIDLLICVLIDDIDFNLIYLSYYIIHII
jgi:hypothetical protein